MVVQFNCSRCILDMVADLAAKSTSCDRRRWELLQEMTGFFLAHKDSASPPELAEHFFALAAAETGITDPFMREKDESTRIGLSILERFRSRQLDFDTRLLLAIGGNAIDYGVHPDFDLNTAEKKVLEALDMPYDRSAAADLQQRMENAGSIFYILDNCGEAVIDRLLIELFAGKITIGVRGGAILNDITRRELASSGLADLPVVDTGCAAPGVLLDKVPADFRYHLENSDLVIAKGQGNFESLSHLFHSRPIYHLLKLKCKVVADFLGKELDSIQIIGRNLEK